MDPKNKKRCVQFEPEPRKGLLGGGGDVGGRGDLEGSVISRLMEKAALARTDIDKLKTRLQAMDDIEDRLYSSLARLMDRYTKPVECDMLRITCLESTIANMQQVDLPRISKLELNHAQQQQQLKLLSTSHDKSLEVELPRISKLELVTAQMQQQVETVGSSQTKAVEEDSAGRSNLASRLKELEDHVTAQKMVTKLTATADMESRIDELKNEVSLLKKIATDTSAEGSEVAVGMKSLRDRVTALNEALNECALPNFGSRLGAMEEKVDIIFRDSQAKVSELDYKFGSAVKEFESSVGTNFTNKAKEFEAYLHSKMKDLVESNLDVNFAIKMKELEASLRKKVKLLETNLKTNFTAKTAELESAFCSRVEDFDAKTKELQANFGSKIATVETSIASQLEELRNLDTTLQVLGDEVGGIESGQDYKSLETQVQDMSSRMMDVASELNDIKAKTELLEVHVQSNSPKPEDQATVLSTLKNYETVITRLSTRLSSLDSMIVSLKSNCLAKEAEFLQKFSEFETSYDYIATKLLGTLPPRTDVLKLAM